MKKDRGAQREKTGTKRQEKERKVKKRNENEKKAYRAQKRNERKTGTKRRGKKKNEKGAISRKETEEEERSEKGLHVLTLKANHRRRSRRARGHDLPNQKKGGRNLTNCNAEAC